jgi:hypothetical protein
MAQSLYGHALIIPCGYLALSGTVTMHPPDSYSTQMPGIDARCLATADMNME